MAEVVLLDTHALLWLVDGSKALSRAAARAIERASRLLIADITLREIAWLHEHGRVELDSEPEDWLTRVISCFDLEVVPISPAIAQRSTRIAQQFHGDPADQLIAATAIELDIPLVTADTKLRKSNALRTVW
ncbi:MAG: type II toxin-antitoxin system VapC family toxin [Archangium sp.]